MELLQEPRRQFEDCCRKWQAEKLEGALDVCRSLGSGFKEASTLGYAARHLHLAMLAERYDMFGCIYDFNEAAALIHTLLSSEIHDPQDLGTLLGHAISLFTTKAEESHSREDLEKARYWIECLVRRSGPILRGSSRLLLCYGRFHLLAFHMNGHQNDLDTAIFGLTEAVQGGPPDDSIISQSLSYLSTCHIQGWETFHSVKYSSNKASLLAQEALLKCQPGNPRSTSILFTQFIAVLLSPILSDGCKPDALRAIVDEMKTFQIPEARKAYLVPLAKAIFLYMCFKLDEDDVSLLEKAIVAMRHVLGSLHPEHPNHAFARRTLCGYLQAHAEATGAAHSIQQALALLDLRASQTEVQDNPQNRTPRNAHILSLAVTQQPSPSAGSVYLEHALEQSNLETPLDSFKKGVEAGLRLGLRCAAKNATASLLPSERAMPQATAVDVPLPLPSLDTERRARSTEDVSNLKGSLRPCHSSPKGRPNTGHGVHHVGSMPAPHPPASPVVGMAKRVVGPEPSFHEVYGQRNLFRPGPVGDNRELFIKCLLVLVLQHAHHPLTTSHIKAVIRKMDRENGWSWIDSQSRTSANGWETSVQETLAKDKRLFVKVNKCWNSPGHDPDSCRGQCNPQPPHCARHPVGKGQGWILANRTTEAEGFWHAAEMYDGWKGVDEWVAKGIENGELEPRPCFMSPTEVRTLERALTIASS